MTNITNMETYRKAVKHHESYEYDDAIISFILFLQDHKEYDKAFHDSANQLYELICSHRLTTKSFEWIRIKAEEGYSFAQCALGLKHYCLVGCTDADHIGWFSKSSLQGNCVAKYWLSSACNNDQQTIELLTESADLGYDVAACNLGTYYYTGHKVEKDHKRGIALYHKSAENGNKSAQYHLGDIYCTGYGTPKDIQRGIKWFIRSAEQGNRIACEALSKRFQYGLEVDRDYKKAYKYYTMAIKQITHSFRTQIHTQLDSMLRQQSHKSKEMFDIMNQESKKYTYPQSIGEWLEMEREYVDREILKTLHNVLVHVPNDVINLMVEYIKIE